MRFGAFVFAFVFGFTGREEEEKGRGGGESCQGRRKAVCRADETRSRQTGSSVSVPWVCVRIPG